MSAAFPHNRHAIDTPSTRNRHAIVTPSFHHAPRTRSARPVAGHGPPVRRRAPDPERARRGGRRCDSARHPRGDEGAGAVRPHHPAAIRGHGPGDGGRGAGDLRGRSRARIVSLGVREHDRDRIAGHRHRRDGRAEAEVPAAHGHRGAGRVAGPHRGRLRVGRRSAPHHRDAGRRRIRHQRHQALHHQRPACRRVHRAGAHEPGREGSGRGVGVHRRGRHPRREHRADRPQDGTPRHPDRRRGLRRRPRADVRPARRPGGRRLQDPR